MICRLWRGWTTREAAGDYERIVRSEVIPGIEARGVPGFRRIDLLRRPGEEGDEVEFATLMWFDDLGAVRAFAGHDHAASHVPPRARAVLRRFDARAVHFEVLDRRPQEPVAPAARLDTLAASAALVVVDVQCGFDDPAWGARNNLDAEARIARLLEAWRRTGRPVFHLQHASTTPQGRLRPGTAGHAIKPEARPEAGEPVYVKTVNSGFIGTTLEADLRHAGAATVVLVGLTTNHCVSTTARMAGNLGFETLVVSDATAAFDRGAPGGRLRPAAEVHEAALSDLDGEFARIVDTAALLRAVE